MAQGILYSVTLFLGVCHAERSNEERMTNLQNLGDGFHVGVVQWNLKDDGVTDKRNSPILRETLTKALSKGPELFAFTYQENLSPTMTEMWLKRHGLPDEYMLLGHHWRHAGLHNMKKFHGSSGVVVFHKVNGHEVQVGPTYQSGTHHMVTGKNDEKGLTAIPVNIAGKKVCFGAAHLQTGEWNTTENTRMSSFNKYAHMLMIGGDDCPPDENCHGCDAAWFGGDFNWRNGGWKKTTDVGIAHKNGKGVHSHFNAEGVREYFASLSLMFNKFYQAERSGTANLPAVLVTNDERSQREAGWLEGPATDAAELLNYPPTFQPAKCPPGGVDGSLAGWKMTAEDGDKDPVCLKTNSGGNCNNTICMSGQRPLAFTDAIYHKSISGVTISSVLYGPVFMPLASDHFPMVGSWSVAFWH